LGESQSEFFAPKPSLEEELRRAAQLVFVIANRRCAVDNRAGGYWVRKNLTIRFSVGDVSRYLQ
jgi:hypothetical protein